MGEPRRIDDEITAADLAGRRAGELDDRPSLPSLLHKETHARSEPTPAYPTRVRDEAANTTYPEGDLNSASDSGPMTKNVDAVEVPGNGPVADNSPTPLFAQGEFADFRSRWSNIQTGFVDEPRRAVQDADNLVASLMTKLAEGFAHERERLERQWDRGENVSTEDLRVALQRYRTFFDRLLRV